MSVDSIEYNGKRYRVDYKHQRVLSGRSTRNTPEISPNGGMTVGYITLYKDKDGHGLGGLTAAAVCSKKDVYSKHKGRELCKGRLLSMLVKLYTR